MSKELRVVHTEVLLEMLEFNPSIMVLEADLTGCISTKKIADRFPDNFVQCGIAEANMIGVAAGLSAVGKVPFVHSFGCFATRRCFDQLFLSGGYAKQHIVVFGSDAGVTAVTNGGTHMPFEDIGLARLIPGAIVMDVSDENVLKAAMHFAHKHKGVNYIRSTRKDLPILYENEKEIEIGKANVLKEGDDLTMIACGICVHEALSAAKSIEEQTDKTVAVIDMHTIKPIDEDILAKYATKTGRIITIENHNVVGGLGDAVASTLLEKNLAVTHFLKLGVRELYGQVGSLDYLKDFYGISATKITDSCLSLLSLE